MMVIRGIYEKHQVHSLNHGIGFDTAAIELLLPTYGESLGLRRQDLRALGTQSYPTLIPAIERGWVKSVQFIRQRSRNGTLHCRSPGCFLYRKGRESAFQSGAVSAGRTIRGGRLRRVHAANGRRRQFVHGDHRRLAGFGGAPTWDMTRMGGDTAPLLAGPRHRDQTHCARP